MTDPACSEFATFLYLLMDGNGRRYFDDAKKLMRHVKEAAEQGLAKPERRRRIDGLSDFCRGLVRRLEADRDNDYRFSIPLAVRDMELAAFDFSAKLNLLGNFELAVRRFERPDKERPRWSSIPPAA